MDVLKTKCAAHNVILGRLEQCERCVEARRATAVAQAGEREGQKFAYKPSTAPFPFKAVFDGHASFPAKVRRGIEAVSQSGFVEALEAEMAAYYRGRP